MVIRCKGQENFLPIKMFFLTFMKILIWETILIHSTATSQIAEVGTKKATYQFVYKNKTFVIWTFIQLFHMMVFN